MKRLLILHTILFLFACTNSRIEDNITNSQKLKVGMPLDEALKVMGKPDETRYDESVKRYYYETPFGASEWITFDVDTSMVVVAIKPFRR